MNNDLKIAQRVNLEIIGLAKTAIVVANAADKKDRNETEVNLKLAAIECTIALAEKKIKSIKDKDLLIVLRDAGENAIIKRKSLVEGALFYTEQVAALKATNVKELVEELNEKEVEEHEEK